jgi:DNA-binding NarL/FixJ family response regulator
MIGASTAPPFGSSIAAGEADAPRMTLGGIASPAAMNRPLRILHLEDSEADAELVRQEFERAGLQAVVERVDSREAFERALRDFRPDAVLSDHSLAQFNARAAVDVVQKTRPSAPVIVVTGAIDEEETVSCLRAGAEDVVRKVNLRRLSGVVRSAVTVRERLTKLSPRQLEVLRLVAEGYTTRAIAQRLQLSAKTVETHRGEVMKRLGVHDLVQLVRYAVRVGLVAPDS